MKSSLLSLAGRASNLIPGGTCSTTSDLLYSTQSRRALGLQGYKFIYSYKSSNAYVLPFQPFGNGDNSNEGTPFYSSDVIAFGSFTNYSFAPNRRHLLTLDYSLCAD